MATVRKRGAKWQARIRIKGQAPVEKSFPNRADAEKWAKITESEMIRGMYIRRTEAERMTLEDALKDYASQITPKKRSADNEKYRIKLWKRDKLAKRSLASLQSVDFSRWRDERLKVATPATVRRELGLISHLFNVARREWSIAGIGNPIEGIKLPPERNARERIFYDDEEPLLLAALDPKPRNNKGQLSSGCRNIQLKQLVMLALETAMRRGELLSLRWENIRLKDRVAYLPMTKNGQSRAVPLSSKAIEILNGMTRKLYGCVFDSLTANSVRLGFTRAVKRARGTYIQAGGDDPRMLVNLHMHDLRHIAITRLAEKLPNIIELAAVSGHSDVRMLKRYYHPKAEELAKKLG